MTIQTNNLSFLVTVTGVTGITYSFETIQNVKKPISDILYLESLPNDATKLSYIGSSELNVPNNLYISDKSDELWGNAKTKDIIEFVSNTNPIDIKTKNFLVTQVYTESGLEKLPLFYKYVFEESSSLIDPSSIKIFDTDFNEVPEYKYKIEPIYKYSDTTGVKEDLSHHFEVYNDLQNYYNESTGEIKVYFIQYTRLSDNTTITVLLNNEPAYREAEFKDIWTLTGNLKPWEDVYELSLDNGLSIRMSKSLPTYVRYIETKRVKLNYPTNLTNIESWNLRVVNGNFSTKYGPYNLNYKIKEFSDQAFNPIEPYKLSSRVSCEKISKNLIKLPNEKIEYGDSFSYVDLVVLGDNDNVKYAITNNPEKEGIDYVDFDNERIYTNGVPLKWNSSLFLSIDQYNGIVHLGIDILDSYTIYGTYTYKEDCYVIKNLNLNPVFDNATKNEIKVIYLVPSNSPTNDSVSSQIKSINWLKVGRSGKILAASQNGLDGNVKLDKDIKLLDSTGTSLDGILGMHYTWEASTLSSRLQEIYYNNKLYVDSTEGFPKNGWLRFTDNSTSSVSGSGVTRYVKYTKKKNNYFLLSNQNLEVPDIEDSILIANNTTVELVNFVNERSTNSNRIYQDELDHRLLSSTVPVHCSRYFVLGEVSINLPHKPSDSLLYDIRQNGGGIKQDKYIEAKYKNERATWINDKNKYNGQVYPGNAVIVIKLPESIKEQFSENQINSIIEENVPFGIMPVIEYYGYQPEIISILPV